MKRVSDQHTSQQKEPTISNLKKEIKEIKTEIVQLKNRIKSLKLQQMSQQDSETDEIEFDELMKYNPNPSSDIPESSEAKIVPIPSVNLIDKIVVQKWFVQVKIIVAKNYSFETSALIDSGADLNCINEGLVPSKYFDKTTQILNTADGSRLFIKYKLSNASVCNNHHCIDTPFIIVKGLSQSVILGVPFFTLLYPLTIDETRISSTIQNIPIHFNFIHKPKVKELNNVESKLRDKERFLCTLKQEIKYKVIEEQLQISSIQQKIQALQQQIETSVCSEHPNAFWERKKHSISLPYESGFDEKQIPTKARPIQMNTILLDMCRKEVNELTHKKLIRPSSSPWSCSAFYVNKNAEKEQGVPRLVINYKPLNKVLKWIRYSIPNKKGLLDRVAQACIFFKFDMKSGYWQIQIQEQDKYKTAFNVPFAI
ncbi:hypothetical protein AMTRI_Chr13g119620 [Amborella trichopoda]